VLDCFGAQAAHLVGLSMGGRIACHFAWRYPGRVRSLTLANTGPGFGATTSGQVASLVEERMRRPAEAQAARLIMPQARPDAYRNAVAGLTALRRDSYAKAIAASAGEDLGAPIDEICVPTLIIGSRHDPIYPVALFHDIAARIPGARLVIIEDAGHLSNLEQPERFNQAIAQFVASLH
jgi:3-oxoadipate enol-lactonase